MRKLVKDVINKAVRLVEAGMEKIAESFVNEDMAKASMVLAAWVTAADGEIKESEIAETEKFIDEANYLGKLNKSLLIGAYREWCEYFMEEPEDAIVYALIEISPLTRKPEALAALQLAVRIAKADQDYSDKEKKVIAKACHFLDVKLD
ncbi:MAG: hypothetical protein GY749_41765 [Desulfobacteraceae bacterium]|nr:hypothetical protein [Desulfobacteraceae bacterium]